MQIYFQHYDLKIQSKISEDTLWVSRACGMCRYINNCSYKNTSTLGPEYIMYDHEEEQNTHMLCSWLYHAFLVWLCLQSLGKLSKWFQPGMHCGSSSQICVVILFNTNTHTQQAHISLTSVWNFTWLLTVQNCFWYAITEAWLKLKLKTCNFIQNWKNSSGTISQEIMGYKLSCITRYPYD